MSSNRHLQFKLKSSSSIVYTADSLLSLLHCPNADNKLAFRSRLAPYVSGLGIIGIGVSEVRVVDSGATGVLT